MQCSKWKFGSAGILVKSETRICLQEWKKNINGYRLVYAIDKCWYEIQEKKIVPVWYTGQISNTVVMNVLWLILTK
jgi:hypothetical protein